MNYIKTSRLINARTAQKLSIENMASSLNMAPTSYASIEKGTLILCLYDLIQIADLLDTSIDYLLGRDDFLKSHGVSFDE